MSQHGSAWGGFSIRFKIDHNHKWADIHFGAVRWLGIAIAQLGKLSVIATWPVKFEADEAAKEMVPAE